MRKLNAYAGIVVTASHNPPEYNGYKVYGDDGAQLPPKEADIVIAEVNAIENELTIQVEDEQSLKEKGLIKIIGEEIDKPYTEKLTSISVHPELSDEVDVSVVFTPLHGTANKPVRRGLEALGYKNVTVVKEQELPDPDFSTVKSPNPEEHAAFEYAIKLGEEQNADILVATDPDADRLGIAVKQRRQLHSADGKPDRRAFIALPAFREEKQGTLPENGVVMKTIVTSELGRAVASSFGLDTIDTLTGFKFIGEKIKEYEKQANTRSSSGMKKATAT